MSRLLRITSRKSRLAMWQAEHVKSRLEQIHPDLEVEIIGMTTRGDQLLDSPLSKIGGKGLFVKELERAMLEGEADLAVHSMKDVPMEFPKGLMLGAILERHDPRDAFVSNQYQSLEELPQGAVLGTSSLRRQCQLHALRPDVDIRFLRGNIQTRMSKLDAGEYDAIILAASGLKRMDYHQRIRMELAAEICLPAGGQGALGLELRTDDEETLALIKPLIDADSTACVTAERALNKHLNGGCQVPIGCYAVLEQGGDILYLRGLVGSPDGSQMLTAEARSSRHEAEALGVKVAEDLLAQGAGEILAAVYQ